MFIVYLVRLIWALCLVCLLTMSSTAVEMSCRTPLPIPNKRLDLRRCFKDDIYESNHAIYDNHADATISVIVSLLSPVKYPSRPLVNKKGVKKGVVRKAEGE